MLLSREKAAIPQSPLGAHQGGEKPDELETPTIESFFKNRDYKGALTLIDFEARINGQPDHEAQKWAALAHIRLMEYPEAMALYEKLLERPDADPSLYCYLAACYFYLGMYRKAEEAIQRAPHCSLQNRIQVGV